MNYGSQTGTVSNNLLPVARSVAAGDGSLIATTTYAYDNIGNPYTVQAPLGAGYVTRYRYDADRELVGVVGADPDGAGTGKANPAVRYGYTADGLVTLAEQGTAPDQTDSGWNSFSSHHQAHMIYDTADRRIQLAITNGGTVYNYIQYSYDNVGRLDCVAQRMNMGVDNTNTPACNLGTQGSFGPDRIARTEYDADNRVNKIWKGYHTSLAVPDQLATYTPNGKVASRTDANGNVTSYAYDGFDRLYRTYYPNPSGGGSSTSDYAQLDYDAAGNVVRRWLRGTGNYQSFSYDFLNRPTGITVPHLNASDKSTSYGYDNLGELTGANEENNRFANFTYDALGRKTAQSSNAGGTKTMQYDLNGRRTRLTWQDGFYVTYAYDYDGQMSGVYDNSGAALVTWGYDDDGRRTAACRNNDANNCTQYGYDADSRLNVLNILPSGAGNTITLGNYGPADEIGTRTGSNDAFAWTVPNQQQTYAPNGLNQYATVAGATLSYDPHGNLTGFGGHTYSYDSFNRLGEYDAGQSAGKWLYYDAVGKLEWLAATSTRLDYDGDRLITELDGSNTILRRYVYGPGGDEPVVWYEGSGTATRRFPIADERGSIVWVQDAAGNTVAINSYDEYGKPGPANTGRFQYTGQAWLSEVGLYYYKARMYNPALGRFMQTDPIGYANGPNWYNYAGSNPINGTDPSGLDDEIVVIGKPPSPPPPPPPPASLQLTGIDGFTLVPAPPGDDDGEIISNAPVNCQKHPTDPRCSDANRTVLPPGSFTSPTVADCLGNAVGKNGIGLGLDLLGVAANIAVPEGSVATAVVGSTLGVAGIGVAVADNDGPSDAAIAGTLAYSGKQAAVAEGLLGGAASALGHRIGFYALGLSTLYDVGKTIADYQSCRNGGG